MQSKICEDSNRKPQLLLAYWKFADIYKVAASIQVVITACGWGPRFMKGKNKTQEQTALHMTKKTVYFFY